MRLIAHRGSHRDAPENTALAFRLAIDEGADGIELDVRTCASGEVVVAHDAHLGRVADRAAWVAMEPYRRLSRIDLGAGQRVPLLDDVIDLVVPAGLELHVEVKGDVPDRRAVSAAVGRLLTRRRPEERDAITLSTFDPFLLHALKRDAPFVRCALLFDLEHTGALRAAAFVRALRPDGLHPHFALCTARRVRRWTARGLFVHAWTVNDGVAAVRLRDAGLSAVITDDVPQLSRVLRATS